MSAGSGLKFSDSLSAFLFSSHSRDSRSTIWNHWVRKKEGSLSDGNSRPCQVWIRVVPSRLENREQLDGSCTFHNLPDHSSTCISSHCLIHRNYWCSGGSSWKLVLYP